MNEHFEQVLARHEEVALTLAQPETILDQPRFQALMRELSELEPQVAAWQDYLALKKQEEEARELLNNPDFRDMAKEELDSLAPALEDSEQALRLMLLPRDEDDERDVVLEVRAGAGGEEAALFGALLMRMYLRYAERRGYTSSLVSVSESDIGGVREAVVSIQGRGAFSRLKYESGVHRIQRVPATEASGRIHTSTATVAVLPVLEDVQVDINPGDLRVDVYRSSGKGGQHVNTTDSAVRITHLPTGLVVACQNERSQLKNHETALKLLKLRLYERAREERDAAHAGQRKSQVGTGDRSERIRTYNFPQGRVTDHRIGLTLYQIDLIVDGDLDPLIDPLAIAAQEELLAQGNLSAAR